MLPDPSGPGSASRPSGGSSRPRAKYQARSDGGLTLGRARPDPLV